MFGDLGFDPIFCVFINIITILDPKKILNIEENIGWRLYQILISDRDNLNIGK